MLKWELAKIPEKSEWIDNYKTVEQFMAVDLFTVREEDIVETLLRYANEMAEDMGEDGEGQGIDVVAY